MSIRLSSVFPRPSASDPDDVVWTLQTAAVQWQRGLRADAIVWVRKAADTAIALGQAERAEELRDHAARLAEFLWTDPEEPTEEVPFEPRRISRRGGDDEDAEEIIEIEELEGYELEFSETEQISETDLPTPDDAIADISAEDLTYFRDGQDDHGRGEPMATLPDDIDLRSDSERPLAPSSDPGPYLSVSPESDEDQYLSVSPEPDDSEALSDDLESTHPRRLFNGRSVPSPKGGSEQPKSPYGSRQPTPLHARDEAPPDSVRSPTIPSVAMPSVGRPSASMPSVAAPPRPRSGPASQPPAAPRISQVPSGAPATSIGARIAAVSRASEPALSRTLEPLSRASEPALSRVSEPAVYRYPLPSPAPPASAVASREPEPEESGELPAIDGMQFESVEVLADLPEEAQSELAATGRLVILGSGENVVLREGAALITKGTAHVTLTYSNVSAARVGAGAVVAAKGSVEAGPLRLIADATQTHVVTWTDQQLTQAMRDCPWVVDELRLLADRFQAHAGAGLGPLGQRLDDALRAAVYERLQVRVLSPEESIAERGKPLKGLFVAAIGELNVGTEGALRSGEFLFPSCVIGAEPAPHDVKAGPKGGLVLFATRPVAHELMMSVPPLLEILAS
jgi:hypothetical protein